MSLDQKLLAWDAMLARLGAAMASAEAETKHSSALEDRLSRLLASLTAEEPGPDQTSQAHLEDTGAPDRGRSSLQSEPADPPEPTGAADRPHIR